jgi:hypothetical protein
MISQYFACYFIPRGRTRRGAGEGVSDPSGRVGLITKDMFVKERQAIQNGCKGRFLLLLSHDRLLHGCLSIDFPWVLVAVIIANCPTTIPV